MEALSNFFPPFFPFAVQFPCTSLNKDFASHVWPFVLHVSLNNHAHFNSVTDHNIYYTRFYNDYTTIYECNLRSILIKSGGRVVGLNNTPPFKKEPSEQRISLYYVKKNTQEKYLKLKLGKKTSSIFILFIFVAYILSWSLLCWNLLCSVSRWTGAFTYDLYLCYPWSFVSFPSFNLILNN